VMPSTNVSTLQAKQPTPADLVPTACRMSTAEMWSVHLHPRRHIFLAARFGNQCRKPRCNVGPSGTDEAEKVTHVRQRSAAKGAYARLNFFDMLIIEAGLDLSPRADDLSAASQVREIAALLPSNIFQHLRYVFGNPNQQGPGGLHSPRVEQMYETKPGLKPV
jgi:hypothetical protein